jgi:hypothetical protein
VCMYVSLQRGVGSDFTTIYVNCIIETTLFFSWCYLFPEWTGLFCTLLLININCYDFSPPECMVHKDQMMVGP